MPVITIEGPVLDGVGARRRLVKELTAVAAQVYGLPESTMVVLIKENPPENVGSGGELLSDRRQAHLRED